MQKKYIPGINILGGAAYTVPEQLQMLKRVGWGGFFTGWDKTKTTEWALEADRLGLIYQSIHSPFYEVRYLWEAGDKGREVANQLIDCVKDCHENHIPVMVIHPFIGFEDHNPTEIGLENYARIVDVADRLSVRLGFENVEGEEYLAALMERFWDSPACGFCLDTGHEQCYNGGKDMLALYGEKLCHTHFNDNLGVRGEDITFHDDLHFMPTDGIADWHNIMERIRKTGYNDIFMTELTYADRIGKNGEPLNYAQMPIEEYMATALEKIRKAISM